MPTKLYKRLLDLLGGEEQVYEVSLTNEELKTYDRHQIYKASELNELADIIEEALSSGKKLLCVCNQVDRAQACFERLQETHPDIPAMLLHSRYKRADRAALEQRLRQEFDPQQRACIVVSTQVVEVSLDISFDLMITECAPIDSLIQRFGRINRRRTAQSIGNYKPIYILAPPEDQKDAYPYKLENLRQSFVVLPSEGTILHESQVQQMLDKVYPDCLPLGIDLYAAYNNGAWTLGKLKHHGKSALFDLLQINSAAAITQSDYEQYLTANALQRSQMEIPMSYHSLAHAGLSRTELGNSPWIIPDVAYIPTLGLCREKLKVTSYSSYDFL